MITSLSIENFALIEKLDIDFSNGFSIITGETGAGKYTLHALPSSSSRGTTNGAPSP